MNFSACRGVLLSAALMIVSFSAGSARLLAEVAGKPPVIKPPSGFSKVVTLWPNGAPGAIGTEPADVPKLYVYPATGPGAHSAVIVLPGGGYRNLVMEKEGAVAAKWLNAHGVTAFLLEYRLGPRYHFPAPMQDGARAIRYVRSHASEFDLAKNKIGLWGFSAGGHLAGSLSTIFDEGDPKAADPIERVGDRPDFVILSYARLSLSPEIPRPLTMESMIGENATQEQLNAVSVERHVTSRNSPAFIYATTADQTVNSLNATAFYDALKRAAVPVELHIFERGSHGTGIGMNLKDLPELGIYPTLIANWMELHGWMAAQ